MNNRIYKGEIWRDISGYEGIYQISDHGHVRRIINNTQDIKSFRILKPSFNTGGYVQYRLCKNGCTKCVRAHRLVAKAFLKNPNGYDQVNHLNGKKDDNRVKNLEWCTGVMNIKHAIEKGLIKKKKGIFKEYDTGIRIKVTNKKNGWSHIFTSQNSAAKYLGLSSGEFSKRLGKNKKATFIITLECELA